ACAASAARTGWIAAGPAIAISKDPAHPNVAASSPARILRLRHSLACISSLASRASYWRTLHTGVIEGARNRSSLDSCILVERIRVLLSKEIVMPTAAKAKPKSPVTKKSAAKPASRQSGTRLDQQELDLMDAYWRAANYLSVGQIYLRDNPLLRRPLTRDDIKPRLLGHFGTTPGLNFIYLHLNRIIRHQHANAMLVVGPGHGAPGIVANTYLEGTYTEVYPDIERNFDGLKRLFRQFSWPYGIPSHDAANVPGSIHEGGELGYSLLHAYGAAFDNPDLLVTCIVGDGEAETGSAAASWHSNKFLN